MTGRRGLGNEETRLERLRRVLQTPAAEACEACLRRLDDYIAAQLAGDAYLEQYPDVAVHLDACVECAGAYARLYELALAEASDALPAPASVPAPDLNFSGNRRGRPGRETTRGCHSYRQVVALTTIGRAAGTAGLL